MVKLKPMILFLVMIFFMFSFAATTYAYDWTLYIKNSTGSLVSDVNVTAIEYNMSNMFSAQNTITNVTITGGQVTIPGLTSHQDIFIGVQGVQYTNGNATEVTPSLPQFNVGEISMMLEGVNMTMIPAANLYLTVVNASNNNTNFSYQVKDVNLGYPISEDFANSYLNKHLVVPAERNYTIMFYPPIGGEEGFPPLAYNANGLTSYDVGGYYYLEVEGNTTINMVNVSGYVDLSGVSAFSEFTLVPYLVEGGDSIVDFGVLPSEFTNLYVNNNTGFYNMTLPGTQTGFKLLFAAYTKLGNEYYASYNISTIQFTDTNRELNFSLSPLAGSYTQSSRVNTSMMEFCFVNSSGSAIAVETFAEVQLEYDEASFTWFKEGNRSTGCFSVPLLNNTGVKKINAFIPQYAPRSKSYSVSDLNVGNRIDITLYDFNPEDPDGGVLSNLQIEFLTSSSACDVPVYPTPANCLVGSFDQENFNPLQAMLNGKISLRIINTLTGVMVHYVNVDMLASGPPDAAFDDTGAEDVSGSSFESLWRFGSMGPDVYDRVLIGINYSNSDLDDTAPLSLPIDYLYDDEWNVIWNISVNSTNDIPSDYSDFNVTWFNLSTGGMPCSTSDSSADCVMNTSQKFLWLRIPHFSGVGPTANGVYKGNVTLNTSSASVVCMSNCSVYINATNLNYTLSSTLQNITINNSDTTGNVLSYTMYWWNGSSWTLNGTNSSYSQDYNFTLYNSSNPDNTRHRYKIDINKSTNAATTWSFSYDISGVQTLELNTSLTCTESWSCGSWSSCSNDQQTRTCTDANSCGTTADRPVLTQSCDSDGKGASGGSTSHTETYFSLSEDEEVVYEMDKEDSSFRKIEFTVNKEKEDVKVKVSFMDEKPGDVDEPKDVVYQYLNVEPTNIDESDITGKVKISFRVSKEWIKDKGVNVDDVVLLRYDGGWSELDTEYLKADGDYYLFKAESPGFSYFAVAAKVKEEAEVLPEIEEVPGITEEIVPGEVERKGLAWYWWLIIILVAAVIIGVKLWLEYKKKPLHLKRKRRKH